MDIQLTNGRLARLTSNPSSKKIVEIEIDRLILPDGREFNVRDLLKQKYKISVINLVTKKTTVRAVPTKYTIEDRRWMCESEPEQVMLRYNLANISLAKQLIARSKKMLNI